MKKLVLTAAVLTAAVSLTAADLKINGDFKGSKIGNEAPAGWAKNFPKDKDIGATSVVKGEKDGAFAIQIKTTKKVTPFYSGPFNAVAGDTVKITAKVKGKGSIQLAYYAYGPNYLISKASPAIAIQEKASEYESKLVITEAPKGKISAVRIVFQALPDSDVTVSDVKAEIIPAK